MLVRLIAIACLLLGVGGGARPLAAQETLTVFAAASMKNALDDVDAAFAQATGGKVAASYAASSALARQIEQGAPADVFASADLRSPVRHNRSARAIEQQSAGLECPWHAIDF